MSLCWTTRRAQRRRGGERGRRVGGQQRDGGRGTFWFVDGPLPSEPSPCKHTHTMPKDQKTSENKFDPPSTRTQKQTRSQLGADKSHPPRQQATLPEHDLCAVSGVPSVGSTSTPQRPLPAPRLAPRPPPLAQPPLSSWSSLLFSEFAIHFFAAHSRGGQTQSGSGTGIEARPLGTTASCALHVGKRGTSLRTRRAL